MLRSIKAFPKSLLQMRQETVVSFPIIRQNNDKNENQKYDDVNTTNSLVWKPEQSTLNNKAGKFPQYKNKGEIEVNLLRWLKRDRRPLARRWVSLEPVPPRRNGTYIEVKCATWPRSQFLALSN